MLLDKMLNLTSTNSCMRNYMNCLFPSSNPFTIYDGQEYLKRQSIVDFNALCLSSYFNCWRPSESFTAKVSTTTSKILNATTSSFISKAVSSQKFRSIVTKTIPTSFSSQSYGLSDKYFWLWLVIALIIAYIALTLSLTWVERLITYLNKRRNSSELFEI